MPAASARLRERPPSALRYARGLLFAALGLYALMGLRVLGDYGPNPDSFKNWGEGRANLDFLVTGKVDEPAVWYQTHGALFMMAAELSRRALGERLGLLDEIDARHVVLIPLNLALALALFRFVRLRSDPWTGLVAALGLLTYPEYFGFSFNNLKDIPLVVFFSLAMMAWVDWTGLRRLGAFYSFFAFWGLALCAKLYAFLAPVLLAIWTLSQGGGRALGTPRRERSLRPHLACGLALAALLVAALYAPAWWGMPEKGRLGSDWTATVSWIALNPERGWSVWPFEQLLLRVPVAWLGCAAIGLWAIARDYRRDPLSIAIPWLLVPLLIPCLPGLYGYQSGLRLLLLHSVPLSILAASGGRVLAGALAARWPIGRVLVPAGLLASNLHAIVQTHPYQTTFFNALAGGLGGAQAARVPSSSDYWMNSLREIGRWLDANAAQDAEVLEVYRIHVVHPPQRASFEGLLRRAVRRPDLRVTHREAYFDEFEASTAASPVGPNTYVIFLPSLRDASRNQLKFERLAASGTLRKVYEIKRQGGLIAAVYHRS
ncbi:MAG: glycosyltransferase family 39 protein [Elusimicrobia bacterium]|nr:glycosyltransferase family 39 protein [Elusimicrobiota bacterium]